MASVSRRRRKVGVDETGKPIYRAEGWNVRFVDPDGQERLRVFASKDKAAAFAAEVESTKKQGTYVDDAAGRETFQEYAERWRKTRPQKEQTMVATERRLRNHVYPTIGDRPLSSLRPSDLQGLVSGLAQRQAHGYAAKIMKDIKAVCRGAVLDRLIGVSPAESLRMPPAPPKKDVVLFADVELDAIEAALPDDWVLTAQLGVGAGLRIGEVLGLRIDRVDFLRREIRVDSQMQTFSGRGAVAVTPKTASSYRTIPVASELVDLIAAHVATRCADQELLFVLPDGRNVSSGHWSKIWTKAVRDAGLVKGTRFHWLRHTYASALIHGGCSPKEVQARLGHATITETLDTYGHLWPDSDDRTREASGAVFRRRSDQNRTNDVAGSE